MARISRDSAISSSGFRFAKDAGCKPASQRLCVCGYQFSDRQPTELASLFTLAVAELKTASR